MKIEYTRCDGCRAKMNDETSGRVRVSNHWHERGYDLCEKCWGKMLAAVKIDGDLQHRHITMTENEEYLRTLETALTEACDIADEVAATPLGPELLARLRSIIRPREA